MAHDPNKYTIDHLMRCLLDETRQTRIIASSILSETQAINANTDEVETKLNVLVQATSNGFVSALSGIQMHRLSVLTALGNANPSLSATITALQINEDSSIADLNSALDTILLGIQAAPGDTSALVTENTNLRQELVDLQVHLVDILNGIDTGFTETNLTLDGIKAAIESGNASSSTVGADVALIQTDLATLVAQTDQLESLLTSIYNHQITPVSPTQEVITTEKTYTNFKSLTFTVYDGTADVTVGGVTLTYPLGTSVLGASWEDDNLTGAITITPTGSTLVTTILKL